MGVNGKPLSGGRTTFYHHYSDKFDWLEQTIVAYLRELTAGYHLADLHNKDTIIRNLAELFRSISSNPRMCGLILANENTQLMYNFFWESMLEQFRDIHGAATLLTPEEDLTLHYVAASTSALVEWWVRNNTLFSPEQMAQCIYSFHHFGEAEKT